MIVHDLIKEAAIMSGMTSLGDSELSPELEAYGFSKCNQLIDLLATDRLAIYREQRVGPFNVTSGMGDATVPAPITIGVGATWNTPRPVWIDRAGIIYTAGSIPQPELAMHVFTTQEWARIVVKGITATLSRALFYDHVMTSAGYGNIYLYPVPSASFQVVLYNPVAMAEFPLDADGNPDYTTAISLPPGYRAMLVSNLAVIMSLGIIDVPADVRIQATNTLAAIKASNVVTHMDALSCDEAVQGRHGRTSGWDWITGEIN